MAYRSVASASGSGTAISVSVPSGAAQWDIAWVDLYLDSNGTDSDAAITAPSGFNLGIVLGSSANSTRGRHLIYWKRLTGADSGTYDFAQTVSAGWEIVARLYSGRVRAGNPWSAAPQSGKSVNSVGTTVNVGSVTPGATGSDLVGGGHSHATGSNAFTVPTGYTERYDASAHLEAFDIENASSSATGTIVVSSASSAGGTFIGGYQVALAVEGHVVTRSSSATGFSAATSQTVTLPEHAAGDRITIVATGKYDTTTIPTIDQGFTLVASGTGGTGATGTADVGPMFIAVYQKDAASSSETNPTLTVGGTAPNSWGVAVDVSTPAAGMAWRDAITTSASYVKIISDTDTASPLTGTAASSFSGQPTTGDKLAMFGGIPTDATLSATHALTATGLSGGTVGANNAYAETTLGNDMALAYADWLEFTGTASSAVTATMTFNTGNQSGVIAVVAFRQQTGATTISGGQASVTSTAQAGSTIVGSVIAGGLAATTSTALAGSVLLGYVIAGGQAPETDTAQAGVVVTGQIVVGGQATEADSALAGSVTGAARIVGGQASEADSASAGSIAQVVTGGTVTQTSTAQAGNVVTIIVGGQAGETDTARAGSTGATLIVGGQASELVSVLTGSIALSYAVADTSNRDDGIDLEGTADVIWEPDVVPVPSLIGPRLEKDVRVAAQVIDTPPGVLPAFTKAVGRRQYAAALRERVLVGDTDVSFLRDVPVTVDNIRLIDPLRYGSASITLPQVDPAYSTLGSGDLAWVTDFAPVRVQLVDADDVVVVPDYYKGFITRINTDGPSLSLDLGGQAAGSLSLLQVPNTVYRRKQDVEHILVDLLRDARVRAHEHAGSSGVGLVKRGAADGLTLFNETLAVWAGATDSPITFTPRDSDGAYRKTVKDTATIHGTVYVDHGLISQSIARDLTTENRRVYANGFTEVGELVTNIKTPGMTQGETPAFPLASGSLVVDMTDADTTTGAGITALQEQLALHNWLDIDEAEHGVFDDVTAAAVVAFKTQAGTASLTPAVSESAWDLLWNLTRVGYSLDDAREYPMAEDPKVRKWNRTANGSKIEENPDYDPHIKPVGEFIDVGGPFTGGEIRGFAVSRLRTEDVWVGTFTVRSGMVDGLHNPGDPFTSADVKDRRLFLPNDRLWHPYFQGGMVFYITGAEHGLEESVFSVSTKPESTYETWAAIARVREAKSNVARMAQGHVRQSQVRRDVGPSWDKSSGWLANKVGVVAGWNEVKVPAGQAGLIQRVKVELQTPGEFALLLTKKRVSIDALNTRAAISEPLAEQRPAGRPWWERPANVDWLDERGLLVAYGTAQQPCGYDPSLKTDEQGPTAAPITGKFVEQASADYETDPSEPVLFMYVWVGSDNHVLPGRVLRNQRTADF